MPDTTNTLLDQLEEWLEAQVPTNLHDLPYRMLETMERVTNELFDALNVHGPPSISLPFPPFNKEVTPPAPPPPRPSVLDRVKVKCAHSHALVRFNKLYKAHPYAAGAAAVLALGVGLGAGGMAWKWYRQGKFGTRGRQVDGMLKDAVVILAPSPMPPLLWALTVSLLRAGYIVLVAVANLEDAEQLEKRLHGLECKSALRVLIYDPEDPSTFPPFHRSLQATLNLRFQSPSFSASTPITHSASQQPRIHSFISLYPLHPHPPTQPGPLPALPTLLVPNSDGTVPKLITLYSSSSRLVQPDSFASQLLAANHQLLGRNLKSFSPAKVVSVYVGDLDLPTLHSLIHPDSASAIGGASSGTSTGTSRRQAAREKLHASIHSESPSILTRMSLIKDYFLISTTQFARQFAARFGLFGYARDYPSFEYSFLRLLKNDNPLGIRSRYHLGQNAYYSIFISTFLPTRLVPLLSTRWISGILPVLPDPRGPLNATVQGLPAPRRKLGGDPNLHPGSGSGTRSGSATATSSERGGHDDSGAEAEIEDLASSFHTSATTDSSIGGGGRRAASGGGTGSGTGSGLEDSWVGLDNPESH